MQIGKRHLALAAWFYAGAAVVLAIAYLATGELAQGLIYAMATLLLLPAGLIAARVHRLPRRFMTGVIATGLVYLAWLAASFWEGPGAHVLTDVLDLLANAILIALVAYAVSLRRGRFSRGDVIDGIVIGLGAWIVTWLTLLLPYLDAGNETSLGLFFDALYLPMTMPLLALCAMLFFGGFARRPATWFIVGGLLANVLGDAFYAFNDTRSLGEWAFTAADALYVLAFLLTGAGLIHPTAIDLLTPGGPYRPVKLHVRVAFTTLALVFPVVLTGLVPIQSSTDRTVRVVSVLALLLLVGNRLYSATHAQITSQDELLRAARTDDLTRLPNKAALLEDAHETIDEAWRSQARPSFVLFDLDRFKNINDSLGHRAGDQVITVIADRLRLAAESIGARVGRVSGDEFLVLDPVPTTPGQALARAEVLHSVFKEPISIDAGIVFVNSSAGVATLPAGRTLSAEELFRHADIAMYRAKDAGRSCLALYDESMQEQVAYRLDVETALHGALDRREFRLFHQPIVDVESGRVAGFEALIRWQRSDGTLVSPAEFIPIAEDTGIITSIGGWVLLEALTQLRTWSDDAVVPPSTSVSVNVSPRQLADPNFVDLVDEALTRSGIAPHRLWLEVTETVMIDNPDAARHTLQRLRGLGIRIALDDFGTGYSSLSLLQHFPIQRIKIDRSFVHGIAGSSNDRSLVRSIVALGDSMGLDIVAEGVEAVDQLNLLRELGCAKAQGFLISHPVPAEAMRSTVAALESLAAWPEFSQVLGRANVSGDSGRSSIAGS